MKYKVFVDGQEGTTGLRINDYLSKREDIEILTIAPELRKDEEAKKLLLNEADIVFLCLPDSAAKESVALVTSPKTRILDASTAHRTNPDWVYGLPELCIDQRTLIRDSRRVAVPGCHATGFLIAAAPLVQSGLLHPDSTVTCHSISGYSGGGKKLIERFAAGQFEHLNSPKPYALSLCHKHLPEMQKQSGLSSPPVFMPLIANFYNGMAVSVPLLSKNLKGQPTAKELHHFLADFYQSQQFIRVMPFGSDEALEDGFLDVEVCNGTNRIDLFVFGHEDQLLITARFDNLGKGASGAAIQCMNIMLGVNEITGLSL